MDYLLRTTTESDMDDALIAAGLAQEVTDTDGEVMVLPVSGVAIDRIGPIPAQVDEDGVVIKPGDSRYHMNVRIAAGVAYDADELPTFTPLPVTPYRVWFDG
jgi:hypothetical protein